MPTRRTGPEASTEARHLGGAIRDVPTDATAYAHRDAEFLVGVSASWRDPAEDDIHPAWAGAAWDGLRVSAVTREVFYPGFPGFVEGDERARVAYGDNLDRLAGLKAEYDSENLLRSDLNVAPARRSTAPETEE